MNRKSLYVYTAFLVTLILLFFNEPVSAGANKEQLIDQVKGRLGQIYLLQQVYYVETGSYSARFDNLGIAPETFPEKTYWDFALYGFGRSGYVVEVTGIKDPVVGEVWFIDHNRVVAPNTLLKPLR